MQFKFIIKDSRYDSYKKIAASLLLLNALIFIIVSRSLVSSTRYLLYTAVFVLIAYAYYFWKYKKKKENSFLGIYLLAALAWVISTPSWYFALLYAILSIIQLRIENDMAIVVSEQQIEIQSFFPSEHQWAELSNVVVQGGLLTLDFKNNKILQVEPEWSMTVNGKEYPAFEKEFNDFCRQQLNK
jgi:hypothetical protein